MCGILLTFLIFILGLSCNIAALEPAEQHQANALWMELSAPSIESIGQKFNLTAWLNITEDCFAWQLKILFDFNYFNISRLGYTNDGKSDFFSEHSTIAITPVVDMNEGYVILGETLLGGDSRSSGYGSLAWIEFNMTIMPPAEEMDFSFSAPYGDDTYVLNPFLDTISMGSISGEAISIAKAPSDDLIRNLLIAIAIAGISIVVVAGIIKRRRAEEDE